MVPGMNLANPTVLTLGPELRQHAGLRKFFQKNGLRKFFKNNAPCITRGMLEVMVACPMQMIQSQIASGLSHDVDQGPNLM